ncbi:MAG: hypothetical protein A2315_04375 [Ignavibacteria bacterium RIFOXYB2_FULL_35_12]|nr:MAG: hypothetical protein A2058_12320 [Ignavibacteria bacterium GWA2_36_19]OGU56632.1 MAG: hypothetical protein A2X60_05995 [Ignavibacteria bacterium GWF2_35_20]OGU81227.1 MAG: hypothetical protein A2254_12390 [Ignavibacteria bacterium RIFOXYA2_FULL_35_9]OGU86383.1 MAG: hypothetical protein A3K31_02190 [Ignavibacteria bacterium RIFOXYA12_FULL_35_25]OGU87771.1 MAG: hypothetical protein A2492_12415 [Ignavibacteria bacterium RIFOXYC12_FULL_35_11]OGU96375.1 MAG: hypothetical protein A2347_05410
MNNGSSKTITLLDNNHILHHYSDSFSADGKSKIKCKGLGAKLVAINSFFLEYLKEYQLPIAFIKAYNKNSLRYLKHDKLDFYIKILNLCDKRIAKIFGKKESEPLTLPLFEYHYSNDKNSIISESHLITFNLCTIEDIKIINRICLKVNAILKSYFARRNSTLAEVSCYFGKIEDKIYLIDDFTPNSLKVIPLDKNHSAIDPYNLHSASSITHYTDYLHNRLIA